MINSSGIFAYSFRLCKTRFLITLNKVRLLDALYVQQQGKRTVNFLTLGLMMIKTMQSTAGLFWSMLFTFCAALSINLIYEYTLTDHLSLSVTILAGAVLLISLFLLLIDVVQDICNP
jgi:hypothetical protein